MIRINVLGGLYVTDDGRSVAGAAGQPRRLALLALLVEAGELGITRDSLLGFLWPEADEERGKRALAQALYALRRDLGSEEVISGVKDLRLNPAMATSDLGEFQEACANGNLEKAAELFRGAFVEGFHLPGAENFERWVEERRNHLAHKFTDLLDQLAERAVARGDHRAAVGWLRRLAGQDPLNARIAARLMEALSAQGDIAGALQHARVYETLVRQELDLPPDREVIALAERLRSGERQSQVTSHKSQVASHESQVESQRSKAESPKPKGDGQELSVESHTSKANPPGPAPFDLRLSTNTQASPAAEPAPVIHEIPDDPENFGHTSGWAAMASMPSVQTVQRKRRWGIGAAIALAVVLVTALSVIQWRKGGAGASVAVSAEDRVIAVGRIMHYGTEGGSRLGQPLADMLATNLARVEGTKVVSSARMYELQGQLGSAGDTVVRVIEAARRAGATELVDGSLYETPSGYRLDLRRVDLASGSVLHAYTMQGSDLFALADSGTRRVAGDIGGEAPSGSLADVSTRSVVAYRNYEEGLRAYYQDGDERRAEQLFQQALKEDSTFAMAAFYSGLTSSGDRGVRFATLKRAVDLADKASDRDRLIIRATWAFANSSPAIVAITDTLMVRYPAELEGFLWAGQGQILAGNFAAARKPLHVVIARDSLGFKGKAPRCMGCEAIGALAESYLDVDSLPGAVRITRLWTRLQPGSVHGWRTHAMTLGTAGLGDSAEAALRKADSLAPNSPESWRFLAAVQMWEHKLPAAEELSRVVMQSGPVSQRTEAAWVLALAYRQQGRFREALVAARRYRAERLDMRVAGAAPFTSQLEAQVLFELGRFREAAALFDSTGRVRIPFVDSSLAARNRVWSATHAATAQAAAGDTAGLMALADSMERLGQVSGLGRDRRLHFYVRGLLFKARRQNAAAITAFQSARLSPTAGYSRIALELADALMAEKRPAEAVPVLQAALRSPFEGSSLYSTHTELRYRLARAWEQSGRADSAAVQYQLVAAALEKSDPELTPMRLDAAGRAMRLLAPK